MTLDEFIAFSGWTVNPGVSRDGMRLALRFFQEKFTQNELTKLVVPKSPFFAVRGQRVYRREEVMQKELPTNPFPASSGKAVQITEWMQAIDFTKPIQELCATVGHIFKAFRRVEQAIANPPTGNWYTDPLGKRKALGIPRDQTLGVLYTTRVPFEFLASIISDAFTWIPSTDEDARTEPLDNKYLKGGGQQFFVPRPSQVLESWKPKYVCAQPETYLGKVIDNGHCVRFVQVAARAPLASQWRPLVKVRNTHLPVGVVIATFVDGRYPNQASGNHAAIYAGQDLDGLWVWDQWTGQPVHKRHIRFKKTGDPDRTNNGNAYSVVE